MEEFERSIIKYGDHMKIPTPIAQRNKEKLLTTHIDQLPFELVSDILERLPAEELLRCKCVCKRWCHEIESPDFIKSHTRRITNNNIYNPENASGSVIIYSSKKGSYFALGCIDFHSPEKLEIKQQVRYCRSFFGEAHPPVLVGSCNGLLCFIQWGHHHTKRVRIFTSPTIYTRRFLVYNPIIDEYKVVPPLEYPLNAGLKNGFGYDCMSGDYKIFCFAIDDERQTHVRKTHARAYSLMSNSWEVVMEPCPFRHDIIKTQSMVLSNNALHFITYSCNIYGFDLGSHKYHEIARPTNHVISDDDFHVLIELVELRGCLHLVSMTEIWIMKEYGVKDSWIKLFHFSQEIEKPIIDGAIWGELWMMPYAYSEDGTQILIAKDPFFNSFFRVDLHTQQFKEVQISSSLPQTQIFWDSVTPWVGSFVSPASFGSSTS